MDTSLTALRYLRALLDLAERHHILDRGPPRRREQKRSNNKVQAQLSVDDLRCIRGSTEQKLRRSRFLQVNNVQVVSAPEPGCLLVAHPLQRYNSIMGRG